MPVPPQSNTWIVAVGVTVGVAVLVGVRVGRISSGFGRRLLCGIISFATIADDQLNWATALPPLSKYSITMGLGSQVSKVTSVLAHSVAL